MWINPISLTAPRVFLSTSLSGKFHFLSTGLVYENFRQSFPQKFFPHSTGAVENVECIIQNESIGFADA